MTHGDLPPTIKHVPGIGSARRVVLVEGDSDAVVVRRLMQGADDLPADVVSMGGITNIGRYLEQYVTDGCAVAGLYDAAERRFVARALRAVGQPAPEHGGLEAFGFFVCDSDLEDELIRALGVPAVLEALDAIGDRGRFDTFGQQPQWRDRAVTDQLHRFAGAGSGRKLLLADQLSQVLTPGTTPEPLSRLVDHVRASMAA